MNGGATQRHRLAMIALLACAPERQMSRDKLMAQLWPEADAESGQNLLRVALHALRRALGSEALLSDGPVIRLDATQLMVDVIDFEAAFNGGRFQDVVALYRGPFMDGFHLPDAPEFDRWMDMQRSVLQKKCLSALRSLAEASSRLGGHQEAAEWWRRAAALEQYDSAIAISLMRALGAAGDIAGAVLHGRSHARVLESDLGVQPTAELLALEADLREGRIRPAQSVADPPRGATVPSPSPSQTEFSHQSGEPLGSVPSRERPRTIAWLSVGTILFLTAALLSPLGEQARDSLFGSGSTLRRNRVIVLPLANQTGDSSLTLIGRMAADWVTQGLQRSGLVEVIDPYTAFRFARTEDSTDVAEFDTSRLLEVATSAEAGKIVWGSLSRHDSALVMHAQVIDADDGKVLRTLDPLVFAPDDIGSTLETLRTRVAGALATLLDERVESIVASSSPPPTFEAYQEYVRGLDRFGPGGYAAAARHFERAAQLDSTFILARFWMAYALSFGPRMDSIVASLVPLRDRLPPVERFGLDMFAAGALGDTEAQLKAARAAANLAPQSSWRYNAAEFALQLGRAREALAELAQLNPSHGWIRGFYGYWLTRANAEHELGEYEAELETGRLTKEAMAAAGGPFSVGPSFPELRAYIALGRFDDLEKELMAGVQPTDGRNWSEFYLIVGRELRAHGFPDRAQSYFERCLESNNPNTVLCLYELGRYQDAYAITSKAGPQPVGQIGTMPHLVAARLGRRDEAEAYLARQKVWPGVTLRNRRLLEEARVAAIFGDTSVVRDRLKAIPVTGWVRQMMHIRNEFDLLKDDPMIRQIIHPPE